PASHEGHPCPPRSTLRRRPARSRRSPATSPAQYPAGSGVGVCVLLRQPYGLKRVLAHRKELETGSLAVTHGPKMCDTYLDSRATAPGSGSYPHEYHDLIATQEELFWLRGHFLERFQFILKRAPDIVAPAIR